MSKPNARANAVNDRVTNYRARADREGFRRVETTVSTEDVNLIKDVARVLRENGARAGELRVALRSLLPTTRARTGEELLAFFQEFPPPDDDEEESVEFERDDSPGRTVDLE